MATAVKICGITRVEDGLAAARAGAHAIGLVFHPASPRFVTVERAREVALSLPPFITAVALFVNPDVATVRAVLRQVPVQLLQFHGEEPPALCEQFDVPYIKAVRMAPGTDLLQYATRYRGAKALLVDSFRNGVYGGSGHAFDWKSVPRDLPLPVVLAGGLTAQNVGEAVRIVRPWAVDVSSGVERQKGIKDPELMVAFIRGARDADV
jgi:phosphoribosylanthranilate isomerase